MTAATVPQDLGRAWALRRSERSLLAWCLLCMTLGFTLVLGSVHSGGRVIGIADLLPLFTYALCLICLHLVLVAIRFRGDPILVAAGAFLAGFGLLAQYRRGPSTAPMPRPCTSSQRGC